MLNLIKILLMGFILSACVGTIEQSDETIGTVDKNPVADFTFNGVESGLWVSDTKVSVRFLPAFGGGGTFRYQMLDEGGTVLAADNGDNLVKDSNGMYHLTYAGFVGGSINRVMVRAIDLDSSAPDTNEKYITMNLPSDQYPDFDGIDRCEPFPGGGGQTKMNVYWQKGRIYPSGIGSINLPHSVGSYRVYYCKKSEGTDCLEEDTPERGVQTISDATAETMTVAGMEANTSYYFRVTAVSEGIDDDPLTQLEERNIEFGECKTEVSSGPIVFAGIDEVNIENNENGINEADVTWTQATGGFSAYRVYFHPVVDQTSIFNYSHPDIQVRDILDTNATLEELVGLDSFTYHAFAVRACKSLVSDPTCADGSDGSGKFIVKQTKPSVASFAGISGTRNDPANPSNVFLDFIPADISSAGIFDEYRVFVSDGTTTFDITDTNSSNKLGALYPGAPADYQDLYLEGFIKTNIAATYAKLHGLKPSVVYEADVQAWVDRTVPLPISGGNITVEYGSTGTVPVGVTNNDTTPPQIIGMTVSPLSGVVKLGEKVTLVVTYNEILSIAGSPRIGIDVGGVIRYADFASNTPTTMTFEYTAQSGDNDLNGLTFDSTSISLNGAIVTDLSTNNASMNFVAVTPDMSAINVDTVPPLAPTSVVFTKLWLSDLDRLQQASWSNPIADFDHAEVGIGTAGGGVANAAPFVDSSSSNSHNFPDITGGLIECSADYEVLVRAVDGAGLFSPVAASALSFKFDKTAPTSPIISLDGTSSDVFQLPEVSWAIASDSCELDHYEIAVGKDDEMDGFDSGDVNNVMDWTEVPGGAATNLYEANSGIDGMVFTLNAVDNFRVSVRAVDAAGNVSVESSTPDFQVDIAGPSTPTDLAIATNWIAGGSPHDSPLTSWTNPIEPDFQHIKVALGSTIGTEDLVAPLNVGTFTSYTWTGLTSLVECNKNYPKVTAFDDIGNPSVAATHPNVWFAFDDTAPNASGDIDISAGGEDLATNTAPFSDFGPVIRNDNCNEIDHFELAIGWDSASDGFDAGDVDNTLAFTEIPGGDGVTAYQAVNGIDGMFFTLAPGRDYFMSLRVVDKAGNISAVVTSSASFDFILDNTPPDVTITTSALDPNTTSPFPITVTFSEDVTGFEVGDLTITNGSASGFTPVSASEYTANITPDNFGRVTIDVGAGVAQDGASNPNNAAASPLSLIYASLNTFRSIWNVGAETITLPLRSGFSYDFYVDWGDGSPAALVSAHNDPNATHTYASAGTYTITCTGLMEAFYINNGSMKDKITSVTSLGEMGWTSLHSAFQGSTTLLSFTGGVVDQVTDMEEMFYNVPNLASIDTSTWDTGNVVDMYRMFENATLANPDVSGWDVSNVTRFQHMFDDAEAANPNTSSWDTSSATNMHYMFKDTLAANPDVSGWDVSNVTGMYQMFYNAAVATPDTSSWNTGSVTNMGYMFGLAPLANPDVSGWDVGEVLNMGYMFYRAYAATPNTATWDTGKVTDMQGMFYDSPANPDVSSWDVSRVTNMYRMFRNADSANPNTASWNTERVTNMGEMFYDTAIANPNTATWDTSKVTSMSNMFGLASVANPNTASWDVSKVTNMHQMFYRAYQANPNTATWDTGLVTSMYRMFREADLANPDVSGWNTSLVTTMYEMFRDADSANPNTTLWNTGNVTTMYHMFYSTDLADPDVSGWDVSSVTDMRGMFYLSQVADPDTSSWDTSSVTNMQNMFRQAQAANPVLSSWDVSNVTRMDYMFYYAPNAVASTTGSWVPSSVTTMRGMFYRASVVDPNTASWDVSSVTDMREMFREAVSADPDVSGWTTAQVTNMYYMFYNTPSVNPDMSTWSFAGNPNMVNMLRGNLSSMTNLNYSNYLIAVDATTPNGSNKRIDANTLEYQPAAVAARANLISNGWTINDNGAE